MSYSRAMRVFLALSLIVGGPFNSAFAGQVKFTKIDVPGATFGTQPAGINPQGDSVGYYRDSAFILRGFLLSKGKVTTIDVPGAANGTVAAGINPRGDIVGSYFDSGFNSHGFLLSKGRVTFTPPGTTGGKRMASTRKVTLWDPTPTAVGNGHGFLLSKGRITNIDIPGSLAGGTFPAGINPQDDIVGEYNDTNFKVHCFLLSNGTFITFDLAGSPFNVAQGINSEGDIVGSYQDSSLDPAHFWALLPTQT